MSSSTPGSRSGSPRGGGGGGPGPGSGSGGSFSLTLLSPAAPSTSTAATGAVFAAFPLCSMPEAFTGERDFEDYLQQFTRLSQQDFQDGKQPALITDRNILHLGSKQMICISTQHSP